MLLRDSKNTEISILVCHPRLRMSTHDTDSINEFVKLLSRRTQEYPTLAKYYMSRGRRWPEFEIDERWSYPTTLSLANYNTYSVS